ncbi:enhancer of yellow 2 transcription factor-like [Diorhabda carinulata]|uniref:enhancer of yellow 2 transcription factor-like n=1 Tax=Diorhabda sublineata TaxID=1163346 RepID=UPI0024E16406|nr:enhancer of yellow 2 transcription factor-like [Diorhabda sublineata]XP_057667647.1 enhancer of yellow 2 transcription factor-like [Diorhabda carinulata]
MPQDYDSKISLHLDINQGLDRVRELVQTRLIESGWRDQVKLACRKAILDNGENRVPTVDELIAQITPKARSMVPDAVKRELLHELEIILINVDKTGYSKGF